MQMGEIDVATGGAFVDYIRWLVGSALFPTMDETSNSSCMAPLFNLASTGNPSSCAPADPKDRAGVSCI